MSSRWTGGQYSVLRVIVAALAGAQLSLALRGGPYAPLLPALALALSLLVALGWFDRPAALLLAAAAAWLGAAAPISALPSVATLPLALLFHGMTPPAPYGSIARRGAADPGAGWRMPPLLFAAATLALALFAFTDGALRIAERAAHGGRPLAVLPALLETALPLLALLRRARPLAWAALALVLIARVLVGGDGVGPLLLALYAFDPAWIAPRERRPEWVLYDGNCGLCHRAVRLLLSEDFDARLRFAALGGDRYHALIDEPRRAALPDSLVVVTADKALLLRSGGVLHLLAGIGGLWRLVAALAGVLPAGLRDGAYDLVARVRHRLFARPKEACPLLPPSLRERFDP